jgi:hypothetical protein
MEDVIVKLNPKFLWRKVLRTTLQSQAELESTHYQEMETNRFKSKRNQLADRRATEG